MNDIAIRAENLCKQFHIGALKKNRNFREALIDGFKAPLRRAGNILRGNSKGASDLDKTIWALKDVSFEITRGEIVGIIGRNGAGKSTLLKILSRITEPSEGFADIHGRIGSLLEVGTGFHPELTGRENIFLNGAILGMKRSEINRNFDEIVAFAEVNEFIDTPVKHYSSGMYLRLAFAVAAHLEPEILLVDEVLAVGDVSFQKKCLKKMEDIGQKGRTVLFISHDMSAISRLCKRVILLEDGRVVQDGPSHQVVSSYLNSGRSLTPRREWRDANSAPGGDAARLRAVQVLGNHEKLTDFIDIRYPFTIEMEYEVLRSDCVLLPLFRLINERGIPAFETLDLDPTWRRRPRPEGYCTSSVTIPGNFMAEGTFYVSCHLLRLFPTEVQFSERQIIAFHVVDSDEGDTARGDWGGSLDGVVRPIMNWETRYSEVAGNKK